MTKQNKAKVYRQGDVWITQITRTEFLNQRVGFTGVKATPGKGLILAEGEATGHHHRIVQSERVSLRPSRSRDGIVRLLEVRPKPLAGRGARTVDLVHEEHSTIKLPPGYYEVRIQREYEPTLVSRQVRVRD